MSLQAMTLVWRNFPRGGSDKLAMLALADWCNDQGGSLHPSIAALAQKISTSESQARRILHNLINEGWLSVVGNEFGGAPGSTRRYQLNIDRLATGSTHATPTAGARGSVDARGSTHARDGSHRCAETGSTHATQSVIRSTKEPSNKNNGADAPRAAKPRAVTDEQFDALWAAYPKRTGSNPKDKARKALNARIAEGEDVHAIAAGLERYRQHCVATGKINTEFIMQASRFFGPSKEYLNDWETPHAKRDQHHRPTASQRVNSALDEAFGPGADLGSVLEGDFQRVGEYAPADG